MLLLTHMKPFKCNFICLKNLEWQFQKKLPSPFFQQLRFNRKWKNNSNREYLNSSTKKLLSQTLTYENENCIVQKTNAITPWVIPESPIHAARSRFTNLEHYLELKIDCLSWQSLVSHSHGIKLNYKFRFNYNVRANHPLEASTTS